MNLPGPLPPAEQAHCRQTAALSELLAKLAGFPDYEVRTVTQSALVQRHRQDSHPCLHPLQARPADR